MIDTAALRSLVQEAVQSAAPAESGVTAAEMRTLVEKAVAASAPEGASPEQIRPMVEQAVASAMVSAEPAPAEGDAIPAPDGKFDSLVKTRFEEVPAI